MAAHYSLLTSIPTVQVLSSTVVNDVVYCTIQTTPSGAIASIPVQESVFDAGQAGTELTNFAEAIEQILTNPHVVGATGEQTLDASGLLSDSVAFTVQYVPPGTSGTSITAEALIPVAELNFTDGEIGSTLLQAVDAAINAVYANLKAAAGG
jgi:hypothetical protein